VVASVAAMLTFALMYGPLAAFISSLFSGQVGYTGASLSYHLAAAIGGGPAPIIAGLLLARTGSSATIAAYVVLSAVVALGAAALLRDRSNLDHRIDYDVQVAAAAGRGGSAGTLRAVPMARFKPGNAGRRTAARREPARARRTRPDHRNARSNAPPIPVRARAPARRPGLGVVGGQKLRHEHRGLIRCR
jgi:hypothetical protein